MSSPENLDLPGLTQSVTPVLCLLVIVRIEVQIMEDDCVGGCQVDTQTSSPGGEDEDEDVRILVEIIYQILSFLYWGLTIQSQVPEVRLNQGFTHSVRILTCVL